MALDPDMPYSRKEMYLAKAAGEDVTLPECPWSREEYYLAKIAEGGGGGGYVLPIATASELGGVKVGSNLAIDSGTGVLSGNYSAFTGTNGVDAGTTGLVPAPTAADAGKFLKADGTWDTAGGGGPTVVQLLGNSQTDVMSQDAVTKALFNDYNYPTQVQIAYGAASTGSHTIGIGRFATASGSYSVAIGGASSSSTGNKAIANGDFCVAAGSGAHAGNTGSIAVGYHANSAHFGSIAIGPYSGTTRAGEVHVGTTQNNYGYEGSSPYRVIGGVHDGQGLHDAATVAQGNTLSDSAPTTSTVGVLGQLYTDTTNMHTYQCTAISGDTYTWTQRW